LVDVFSVHLNAVQLVDYVVEHIVDFFVVFRESLQTVALILRKVALFFVGCLPCVVKSVKLDATAGSLARLNNHLRLNVDLHANLAGLI